MVVLTGIMSTYGLLEHFAASDDPELLKHHKALNDGSNYAAKDVFEDKRLNQLWAKAEKAGFTRNFLYISYFYCNFNEFVNFIATSISSFLLQMKS